jgi:two-component system, NarL family, invasion response regulator UvrY
MQTSADKIEVLLVDDHAVVREGYRRLLEKRGDIAVVGEAENGTEAYDRFCKLQPQVVVLDIALPGVSGIEAMRRMLARKSATRVLMFSMYEDAIYADRALKAGASGYVTKASAPAVLVEAVHTVARGKRYLSPDVAQKLALRASSASDGSMAGLSPREFEILRLIVKGMPLRDIAQSMGLNAKTIANHQSQIKNKLGAESAVQLIRIGEDLLSGVRRRK